MSAKLIVIEGLDGSGKATQSALLADALNITGKPIRKITFPDYKSDSSALVKMYLSGTFGNKPDSVNAYAASTFYAVDRYASFATDWKKDYERGGIIVADRYTTSNAVHQCAKLPREEWDAYLDWLFSFEYEKMQLPAPDLVIYLDVDPIVSQKLMDERYKNGGGKDIHEKDIEFMEKSREAAEFCCQKLGWRTIHCSDNGKILSIEEIHNKIMLTLG